MKIASSALPVIAALLLGSPLRAEEPSNSMLSTNWSLDKAGKTPPRRQSVQGAANHAQTAHRDSSKPRVFGGARITNHVRGNQGKARGQVGVALPF